MNDTLAIAGHYLRARYRPPFRSRAALERWHVARFARFAREVLTRSPFYRPFAGMPLSAYPVVDKRAMMDAFDRMNTRGLKRDELIALAHAAERSRDFAPTLGEIAVGLSSGTSGRRGLFATSAAERRRYAGVALAKGLRGSVRERQRVALLLRANNPLYETVNASRRVRFAFFDLLAPFKDVLEALAAFAPTIVIGPPQALRLVADAAAAGEIRLTPQAVFAGAEVLDRTEAEAIERAFGVRVDQIYQATEGFLGITCRSGTLHLNEDGMIFERAYVDRASGRFTPIVTDLWRSTQPIVRYRLDDVLIERNTPCPCGSVLAAIARIEGRADDVLFLPRAGDGELVPVMPDFVRDGLARLNAATGDFRVVQLDPQRVDVRLARGDGDAHAEARTALEAVFDAAGVRRPAIEVATGIPLDLSRKLRRVERRFAVPSARIACDFS